MQKSAGSRLNLLLGKRFFLLRLLDIVENEERTALKKMEILKKEYFSSKSLDRKKGLEIEAKKISSSFLATISRIDASIN